MTLKQIEERIKQWKIHQDAIRKIFDEYQELTGAGADGKLFDTVFRMTSEYTKTVSELIGDTNEFLRWYQYDCDMGKNPRFVSFGNGKGIMVKSIRDIARVIAEE